MKKLTIDLSDHKDPRDFLEKCRNKYPDENVSLSLEGEKMIVSIADCVPVQVQTSIYSFLDDASRREIYSI